MKHAVSSLNPKDCKNEYIRSLEGTQRLTLITSPEFGWHSDKHSETNRCIDKYISKVWYCLHPDLIPEVNVIGLEQRAIDIEIRYDNNEELLYHTASGCVSDVVNSALKEEFGNHNFISILWSLSYYNNRKFDTFMGPPIEGLFSFKKFAYDYISGEYSRYPGLIPCVVIEYSIPIVRKISNIESLFLEVGDKGMFAVRKTHTGAYRYIRDNAIASSTSYHIIPPHYIKEIGGLDGYYLFERNEKKCKQYAKKAIKREKILKRTLEERHKKEEEELRRQRIPQIIFQINTAISNIVRILIQHEFSQKYPEFYIAPYRSRHKIGNVWKEAILKWRKRGVYSYLNNSAIDDYFKFLKDTKTKYCWDICLTDLGADVREFKRRKITKAEIAEAGLEKEVGEFKKIRKFLDRAEKLKREAENG